MTPGSGAEEGTSREVLVGLYVRDALGVIDPSGLPRLLGTGLRDAGSADETVNWWWQRWWMDIVDARDDRIPPPPQFAEVGDRLLRQQLDDARTWADVVADQAEVSRLERLVRGDAFPLDVPPTLRLRVEVLPLTTAGIWWIGENAIAVDELLRDDSSSYALALEPIVERLTAGE
ncbi:hypothetical protein [Pseudolysinimonas sp.]